MNGKNKNIIVLGAAVLIIIVAGYFYATRDRSADVSLTSTQAGLSTTVDDTLLSSLRQLRKLKLDNSLFANSVWLSLNDFSKGLSPQPQSRPNPFAPLDSVFSTATGTPNTR